MAARFFASNNARDSVFLSVNTDVQLSAVF
jgi:hypothetical protein